MTIRSLGCAFSAMLLFAACSPAAPVSLHPGSARLDDDGGEAQPLDDQPVSDAEAPTTFTAVYARLHPHPGPQFETAHMKVTFKNYQENGGNRAELWFRATPTVFTPGATEAVGAGVMPDYALRQWTNGETEPDRTVGVQLENTAPQAIEGFPKLGLIHGDAHVDLGFLPAYATTRGKVLLQTRPDRGLGRRFPRDPARGAIPTEGVQMEIDWTAETIDGGFMGASVTLTQRADGGEAPTRAYQVLLCNDQGLTNGRRPDPSPEIRPNRHIVPVNCDSL